MIPKTTTQWVSKYINLYYNPTLAEYKLQGKSMEIGLNRFLQEIAA